jgi:hypothetical protein
MYTYRCAHVYKVQYILITSDNKRHFICVKLLTNIVLVYRTLLKTQELDMSTGTEF